MIGTAEKVTCPVCKGEKGYMTLPHLVYSRRWHICRTCDGTGKVAKDQPATGRPA